MILQRDLNKLVSEIKLNFLQKLEKEIGQDAQQMDELYFSDLKLNSIKEDIFSLPYEKMGCHVIPIFLSNF